METITLLFGLVVLGTLALMKTKHERHLIFFMIRTKKGIALIKRLAKISPRFWKFVGDTGVVVAFSGLGALYLSKEKESRKNLYPIMGVIGLLAVAFSGLKPVWMLLAAAALFTALTAVKKADNKALNFLATSLLISALGNAFIPKLHFTLLLGFLGFPAMVMAALMQQAYDIIQGSMLPGVSPLLPSTKDGSLGVAFPGYDIFIPWWYALISIALTLIPHEIAHGIMSKAHKIKLKTTGVLTAGLLPVGAFVEPDEERLKRSPSITKSRIYAVGSLANFAVGLTAIACLALMGVGLGYVFVSDGVEIVGFTEGYPAEQVLPQGVTVYKLNNQTLTGLESFQEAAKTLEPGSRVELETDQGMFNFTAAQSPIDEKRGYMGVIVSENMKIKEEIPAWTVNIPAINFILNSLTWIIFFNINIGLVNLLPIPPFDGYRIFDEIIKTAGLNKDNIKKVIYAIVIASALIFFLNMIPLFRMLLQFFGF